MKSLYKAATVFAWIILIGTAAVVCSEENNQETKREHVEPADVWRARAEHGDSNAQAQLGSMYYYGTGVEQNYSTAAQWYRKAAEQNNPDAEYALGYMYENGEGVSEDPEEAARWYRKAADHGDRNAQRALGLETSKYRGSIWYIVPALAFVGGLWFSIDRLLRQKIFRSWPRKAAPLRKYLSWVFAFTSVVFAWEGFSIYWDTIHIRAEHPFIALMGVVIFIAAAAIYAVAWWTGLSRSSSLRAWGISASLVQVLFSLSLIVPLSSWESVPPADSWLWRGFAILLGIGIAGLAAFSRPYGAPESQAAQVTWSPSGKAGNLINEIAEMLFFGLMFGVYAWWLRWLRNAGFALNWGIWSRTLLCILTSLTIVILHELGHTVAGLLLGMKLNAFAAGPFQWHKREDEWEFQFRAKGFFIPDGATSLVPASVHFPVWRHSCVAAAGPAVNLVSGAVALWTAYAVNSKSPSQTAGVIAFFGGWSLVLGIFNLLPFKVRDKYLDGAQIYQSLWSPRWRDFRRAVAAAESSMITPLRPRDFDIQMIVRAARRFGSGKEALRLRLLAYSYFLDQRKSAEAQDALKEIELVYAPLASHYSSELLTVFVFGEAYLRRNAEAARQWWTRMESAGMSRLNVDYWLAAAALHWIEGNLKQANEALEKCNVLAQELPSAGAYELDRDLCSMMGHLLASAP